MNTLRVNFSSPELQEKLEGLCQVLCLSRQP